MGPNGPAATTEICRQNLNSHAMPLDLPSIPWVYRSVWGRERALSRERLPWDRPPLQGCTGPYGGVRVCSMGLPLVPRRFLTGSLGTSAGSAALPGPMAHSGFTLPVLKVWLEFLAAPSLASVFGHGQSCTVIATCRGLPCNWMLLLFASLRRFPSRTALFGPTSFVNIDYF